MKRKDLTKLTPAERAALVLRVNKNTRTDEPSQRDKDRTAAIGGYGQFNAKDK